MEVRDHLHGAILVSPSEEEILKSRFFQRLRSIKQSGFAEFVFPSSSHSRYIHSLGAMQVATRMLHAVFQRKNPVSEATNAGSPNWPVEKLGDDTFNRFLQVTRLAALLHDVGHGPLSHTTEIAMPKLNDLKVPGKSKSNRQATHEDYTIKIILDSELTQSLDHVGSTHGFGAKHVASLIDSSIPVADSFFVQEIEGEKINFRPILSQIISSEIDADRMDYLRRDSSSAGVSYGQFDFEWLISNLNSFFDKGDCHLALEHRALYTFEDFLISRFHMFLMVYFHRKCVVYDEMLGEYFRSTDCDYDLPTNLDDYAKCDDNQLFTHLKKSNNPWAKRITENRPLVTLIELHSGIPPNQNARTHQLKLIQELQLNLEEKEVPYLVATSTGELSKYFKNLKASFFVRYDDYFQPASYIPVEKCTDLFLKYSEKRSITRIYVSPENVQRCRSFAGTDQLWKS